MEMLELLTLVVFAWILIKSIGLMLRLTWGVAKIIAAIIMVLALPVMLVCLLFAGGIALLIPIAMVGLAAGIVKACV